MTGRANSAIAALSFILAACGPDPGDIGLFERDAVSSAVVVGTSMASANQGLVQQGYECGMKSGEFTDATGRKRLSAPSFLACAKKTAPLDGCSIRTQVVVVPEGSNVAAVHFAAGDACL